MCSVCANNRRITEEILKKLTDAHIATAKRETERAEYNANCGPMDYDFDCCEYTYGELEQAVWRGLQQLGIVAKP